MVSGARQDISIKASPIPENGGLESQTVIWQCLRILRCTANAFASSPGGWQAAEHTQRWLDGLGRLNQPLGRVMHQGSDGSHSACSE